MGEIPKKYTNDQTSAAKWMQYWEDLKIYRWDPEKSREDTFVVDTPPPTVSGSLHIGHVFSYTHQDLLVRYQRMLGKNISYPMGWDDNGLPTERRVQNLLKIRCSPEKPYHPDWKAKRNKGEKEPVEEVSRKNFIEACALITKEDEAQFEKLWRHLGLSLDWSQQYATIDAHSRTLSQLSFLELLEKGQVYQAETPMMWDVDFQTAVAQAEIEDRKITGAFYDIRFGIEGGGEFIIATTRPELLPACIAVVAHPQDERYKPYFGKYAITPLFHTRVPILAAEHADPEKGTGILMVCTFGDSMDVEWWKSQNFPIRQVLDLQGKMRPLSFKSPPFSSLKPDQADQNYALLVGLSTKQAKKKIAELLAQPTSSVDGKQSALVGEPRSIEHIVKFYERGDRPLEFIPTRQWFIRILDHK
ncbi:MAG: class I tRNA ligase family protein, partial [Ignavibacteriales bacterium]|nr:class I tRNA ligase family protein [Ignavibacteriales bacterium]